MVAYVFDRGQHQRNRHSASSLRSQGQHAKAYGSLQQNLAMSSKTLSEHDLTVLSDQDSLSDCLRELGDYEGAITLDEVTLPIRQRLDKEGHGTHCAALLLELAPNADIYVARVYEDRRKKLDPGVVAKAIMHAADQWKVAIISLSFGWPQYQAAVGDAINLATMQSVLICAAASNGGANDDVAFPANFPPVIYVHSTNEQGKPSNFTPNPLPFVPNFAVLGENVQAAWPGHERGKSQSGTSTATPILAAVMALILEFVDQKPRKTSDERRLLLPDHRVITKVLLAMSDEVDGYRYVRPWKLMGCNVDWGRVESRIQDAIGL